MFLTGDIGRQEPQDFVRAAGRPCLLKPVDVAALQALLNQPAED